MAQGCFHRTADACGSTERISTRAIDALALLAKVGGNLSSLIQAAPTHVVAGTLTAKTGPRTGLYTPGSEGRHVSND